MRMRLFPSRPGPVFRALEMQYKKAVVVTAFFFMIAAAVYFLYVVSMRDNFSSIAALRKELYLKGRLLQVKEENYRNREENEALLQIYQSSVAAPGSIIPDHLVTEALVRSSRLMAEYGLVQSEMLIGERESIETDILDGEEELYKIPFTIAGTGAYEQVISYVEQLMDGNFFYEMEGIRLSSKNVAKKGDMSIELQLNVYGLVERGEPGKEEYKVRKGNPFYYE